MEQYQSLATSVPEPTIHIDANLIENTDVVDVVICSRAAEMRPPGISPVETLNACGETAMKPVLKWAGGKSWAVDTIKEIAAKGFKRYHEPFFGGGAIYFGVNPKVSIVSDINSELMIFYEILRSNWKAMAEVIDGWDRSRDAYYEIRNAKYTNKTHIAARLLYLNRTCHNGLYRVNKNGVFNTPYGYDAKRRIYDLDNLMKCSAALSGAKLLCADFRTTLSIPKSEDFVFVDPPYTVLHNNNGFLRYNESLFSWKDQMDLANQLRKLDRAGCTIVATNAFNKELLSLYRGFDVEKISRVSKFSRDKSRVKMVEEALIMSKSVNWR